jgi:hypothetical protein
METNLIAQLEEHVFAYHEKHGNFGKYAFKNISDELA